MINWTDVNNMQKEKLDLQVKLNEVMKKDSTSEDEINELKSEILYLDKKIKKILGSNEVKRQEEIKNKKTRNDELEKIQKKYYALKTKYNMISNMNIATNHIISVIDRKYFNQNSSGIVKVKI